MGNLGHSWSHQSNTCSFLVVIISLNLALLSSNSGVLAAFGRQEENNLVAAACLKSDTSVSVTCPSSNQKIKILSVAYAYLENCNTPVESNECRQLSTHLSQRAQTVCDGKVNCQVPVVQINQANSGNSQPLGSQESIQFQLVRCGYNRILQDTARMTSMVVTYQCQAFEFCHDIDEEVQDLTISTANYPVTSVSNPTCECTFEAMDPGSYYLKGFTHCNGSVVFVTEETLYDGTVEKFEYPCENAQTEIIYIGNTQPVKIKLTIDAEKSGEESAYKITWFNLSPRDGNRASNAHTKVTCEAGSLWLPYTTKLILMIVIPLACVLLIALIILYCIVKKRRRRAKEHRARTVKLRGDKPSRRYSTQAEETDVVSSGEENTSMVILAAQPQKPYTPQKVYTPQPAKVYTPSPAKVHKSRSRASSIGSLRKQQLPQPEREERRHEPEGDTEDDLAEFAAQMHRKNEERRRKELEKRYGLTYLPSPSRTPPPGYSSHTIQPSRRSRSIGSLHPERQKPKRVNTHASEMAIVGTPLSQQSKSASQSRTSIRSMKRRAPQPPGPPTRAHDDEETPRHPRSIPLYASTTAPRPARSRSRGRTPQRPSQPPPNHYNDPYNQQQYSSVSSPGYSDADASTPNSDTEETSIMRPGSGRPGSRPRPAVAPKPRMPTHHKYNGQRYPPPNSRGYTSRERDSMLDSETD